MIDKFDKTPLVFKRSIINNGFNATLLNNESLRDNTLIFSKEVKTQKVCNQHQSGRCWIFAGLNILREKVAKKHKIENFEFSQNFVMFYDKYERAKLFLKNIDNDEPLDSRLNMFLLKDPISDGGQWDMLSNLIKKYGLVPKELMPETFSSKNTSELNNMINMELRKATLALRNNKKDEVVFNTLEIVYNLLINSLGTPPKNFNYEYYSNKKYKIKSFNSPLDFYRNFVENSEYISIINCPTEELYKSYTIDKLGSVEEMGGVRYLNISIEEMKQLVIKQLNSDELVWFGSDVSKYNKIDKEIGILDDKLYAYYGLDLDKEQNLLTGGSIPNHAMAFSGVNIVEKKSTKWKVENSWGDTLGYNGFLVMSNSWFDKFVYQAVINKKYVNKKLLNIYNSDPIVLPPWHPMGTLA